MQHLGQGLSDIASAAPYGARILGMLQRGLSTYEIADALHKAQGTISWDVRRLRERGQWKVPAKVYAEPFPLRGGKRRCVACGKRKTPGAFPNERNSTCWMCIQDRKS